MARVRRMLLRHCVAKVIVRGRVKFSIRMEFMVEICLGVAENNVDKFVLKVISKPAKAKKNIFKLTI